MITDKLSISILSLYCFKNHKSPSVRHNMKIHMASHDYNFFFSTCGIMQNFALWSIIALSIANVAFQKSTIPSESKLTVTKISLKIDTNRPDTYQIHINIFNYSMLSNIFFQAYFTIYVISVLWGT